jgi:topoisomerase IA-like protein
MENIKPYLGKIEESPVFLNNGKYGWYLNYNDTLYSVPEAFQSKKFDIKTAKKIIDWKEAHPCPSKPPTIAQLDAFEKAKAKLTKESDDESEEDKNLSKYAKLKKKGII